MNTEQLKHITHNHYRKLRKQINIFSGSLDVESIHQFRLEYKKLRAFFRMISQQDHTTGEIKISKKLKKTYSISGAIRDLQLQQQRIMATTKQTNKRPQSYLSLLQKEIDKIKPELSEILLEKPASENKKKTDRCIPDEFPLTGFKLFIQKKWQAINAIIVSDHFSDDNIHSIRKCLKDLYYNLKIYKGAEYAILSNNVWKMNDEPYYAQLLDELGSFQDKCAAISLLKSYWLNSLNLYNRELLERIKKVWLKDKRIMKQMLVSKLKVDIIPQQAAQ